MDESKMRPGFPGDRSQAAAEKLRALRERANQALEGHRSRLGELETQLTERVRQLADEYQSGAPRPAAPPPTPPTPEEELASLRQQVADGNARHAKFVEQLALVRKQFEDMQGQPCGTCQHAAHQLAANDEELHRLREQLDAATRAHDEDCHRHEQFVEQLTAARQAITVLQHAAGESSAELRAELEATRQAKATAEANLAAALRDLDAVQLECDAIRTQSIGLERIVEEAKQQSLSIQEYTASLDQDRATAASDNAQLREQVEALTAQLAAAEDEREDLKQTGNAAELARQALADELAQFHAQQSATAAEHAALVEMVAAAEAEAEAARQALAAAESERLTQSLAMSQAEAVTDHLKKTLAKAEEELVWLRGQAAVGDEVPELRAALATAQADAAAAQGEARAAQSELAAAQAALHAAQTEAAEAQADAIAAQDAAAAAQAQTAAVRNDLAALQTELAASRAETAAATATLQAAQASSATAQNDAAQHGQLASDLQTSLVEAQTELARLRDATAPKAELEAARRECQTQRASIAELQTALAAAQDDLTAARTADAQLGQQASDLDAARRDSQQAQAAAAELQAALMAAQADLVAVQSELAGSQTDLAAAQGELAAAKDEVAAAHSELTATKHEAAETRQASRPLDDFVALEQKFELAVADAHKLKRENESLREELAARPEASDEELPELVAARSELAAAIAQRESLAARVDELESAAAAAATVDVDSQQERDDLQRRFEMAVDDVRSLKQENAKLREQIAAIGKSASGGDHDAAAGTDWAAQKARLMALLDEEEGAGEINGERAAERATVANTIATTERVLADRDKEIADLRAALAAHGERTEAESAADAAADAARTEILDADAVVAAERARLAQLTTEWEGKLRAAELEFSVERAKLAREQAAVRDKMLELESGAAQFQASPDGSKPRRRWLAALGLQDESDEGKKK